MDIQSADQLLDATQAMTGKQTTGVAMDRSMLNFAKKAREAFAFLVGMGFIQADSSPTHLVYRRGALEVDVYHGRQSYEIGAGISYEGTRYALSEIIRVISPSDADCYRDRTATTLDEVANAIDNIASLMKQYGIKGVSNAPGFFLELEKQRKAWSEQYALDVLANQLRPKAEEAFRRGEYALAAELFARIRSHLSPTEIKKLAIAEERRVTESKGAE